MKISLIHPSRGRAKKARETLDYWLEHASDKPNIHHILSIDIDDPQRVEYVALFLESLIIIANNKSVVEATNIGAFASRGDILIYLSDDFKCPDLWDLELNKALAGALEYPWLIKVDDCLQKFEVPVLTIPIMTRALYNRLGYFWHPEYKSMFVDQDLYEVCKKNNWLVMAPSLKFPHEHCSIGKAERDQTYINSEKNWDQGKELFARRKMEGFPL